MTRTVTSPQSDYTILLPGTWATIPLDDENATKRTIVNLVKRQVGVGDRQARQRRLMRDELVKTAADAKTEGAESFALSLELLPGVPFPAAMLTTVEAWGGGPSPTDVERAARLATAFPDFALLPLRAGLVARRAQPGHQVIGSTVTESLRLEYRVPRPDDESVLNVTISAPMVEAAHAELFIELFDSMIDSLTWAEVPA
jgi:hypothetical protein